MLAALEGKKAGKCLLFGDSSGRKVESRTALVGGLDARSVQ